MIDLNADILPGIGLGGITVGEDFYALDIDSSIIRPTRNDWLYLVENSIGILIGERDNIIQLSALAGYRGLLNGKYYVGGKIKDVIDDGWVFNEELDGFLSDACKGVIIRQDLEDATAAEVSANIDRIFIEEISVGADDFFNLVFKNRDLLKV